MSRFYRFIILVVFIFNTLALSGSVSANEFVLPQVGARVKLSSKFSAPIFKGIKVNPHNPFLFDFLLQQGDSRITSKELKVESEKLIKYFLSALTLPEADLWVNLSPYEKDRIINENFSKTEMGRVLLSEDYLLKQITASLLYPEDEVGRRFWNTVYAQAAKRFGTTNIPVNTFNKVWIVPSKAVIYESKKDSVAYVTESSLKVMLEEDYLSKQKSLSLTNSSTLPSATLASEIIREIIVPELTKEVNEGENFAKLRQVYHSLILAAWYKKKIRSSILSQVYADKNKVNGLFSSKDNIGNIEQIYQQYLKAFKTGVYNYIKEEQDELLQKPVLRKYFSGGLNLGANLDSAMIILNGTPDSAFLQETGEVVRASLRPFIEQQDVAMVVQTINALKPQLLLSFSTSSTDTIKLKNWPTIDQINRVDVDISDETRQMVLLGGVKNKNFDLTVQGEVEFLMAIAYFRQLHAAQKERVLEDLQRLGYRATSQWVKENHNKFTHDLIGGINEEFGIQVSSKSLRYVQTHDQSVRRARGIRLALETVASLKGVISIQQAQQIVTRNSELRATVFGLRKMARFTMNEKEVAVVRELLWGLKQIEGISIKIVRLGQERYIAYEENSLKHLAQEKGLSLGLTIEGLEHLIKLDMAKKQGVFYEFLNRQEQGEFIESVFKVSDSVLTNDEKELMVLWDSDNAFWRARPLARRILEIERTPIQTVYLATMNREVALRTQLEAEAESNVIFNRQPNLVIVDDSSPEILEANKRTLKELYERYGWTSWHITPKEREQEYDAYAQDLAKRYQQALDNKELHPDVERILRENGVLNNGTVDMVLLRRYLARNAFFHISGVRNRTLLKAKGEGIIMSMDDDAPPETYVIKKHERERLQKERLRVRNEQMRFFIQEVGKVLDENINNEEELYKILATVNDAHKNQVDVLIDRYFGYDPNSRVGRIPMAMGQIKKREEQMLDQDGWGKKLGISHQRYHGLMTPLAPNMLTMSDFVYPQPRTEKKQGAFDVLPVNVHRMGDLVGKKAGDTQLPLMGSPLDGRGDLRGTMAQPVESSKRKVLAQKVISYVAAPFVEDQDTSGIAQFIRYLGISPKRASNLQHANQSALLNEGVGGFVADTYVIFNRAALSNEIVSPSIGRDLRLEEPPFIVWVKSPMLEDNITVAYAPTSGGQQREIGERMYDIDQQDYTEVVGVIARATYERAVRRFYREYKSNPHLLGEGKHYERLRFLGKLYIEEASAFVIAPEQLLSLDFQRKARAMMLAELSLQKSDLERKLALDPSNISLAQEIRDIDLIFVQYAESFVFYHAKDRRNLDYSPKSDQSDYFYRIRVNKEGKLEWERVQPYLEVKNERGVKVATKTSWLKHGSRVSGEINIQDIVVEQAIEIENGRSIVLKEIPKEGDEYIVPVLFTQMESEFISNVHKKAADQIRSDGELLIVWQDLVDVAIPWRQEASVHNKSDGDKPIIERIRNLSVETERLNREDSKSNTPLRYSFYSQKDRRVKQGRFSIQFNPDRLGKRPSQYTGDGIKQAFNPEKFNYNKIPAVEVISEDVIGGMKVSTIVNVSPFAEGHFLLVPERAEGHPQYLDKTEYIQMVLERISFSQHENLKITYNSLGAFASINHLHFQGFYYGDNDGTEIAWNQGKLPIEQFEREEVMVRDSVKISRVKDYPAHVLVFQGNYPMQLSKEVFKYVNLLNEQKIAYNILFTKSEVIVMPRKYEEANFLGAGTAVLEMAGEFIAFDQLSKEAITEEKIVDELRKTSINDDVFDETLVKFQKDSAMINDLGGIDFNTGKFNLEFQKGSDSIVMDINPELIEQLQRASGFYPVVLDITPRVSVSSFINATVL